ncbi:MAG: hypothetical protein AABX84_02680, partial [Nanoarchaeota archaeon]
VQVKIDTEYLTLGNFRIVQSDVEFLARKKIKYLDTEEEPGIRCITVQGGPKLCTLEYFVTDYSDILFVNVRGLGGLGKKEYTHAQIREMRGYQKRRQRKAE